MAAALTARRVRGVAALAAALILATSGVAASQPAPPTLTAAVNDFAHVIDASSAEEIARLSQALLAASGDAVVVATVQTFQPWGDIQSYATKMFQNGGKGLGGKTDTGLLVLLAVDDRQVWIEVGYGLEGAVTDGFAGETSRRVMTPYFRQGQYGPGLAAGTRRLVERIASDRGVHVTGLEVPADVPTSTLRGRNRTTMSPWATWILILVVLIILSRLNRGGRRGRRRGWHGGVGPWGGGYYGGGWGGGSSWGGGSWGGSGGFGGFGGGRSGGGGGGASW